jgi:hypothetical protein
MHDAPNPPTWSTTRGLSVQVSRRNPPRGRVSRPGIHRIQGRGRPPGPLRCRLRRTLPRGRPPGRLRRKKRIETLYVGEYLGRGRIELPYVVDHLGHFDAWCTETLLVCAHQGQLSARIRALGVVPCGFGPHIALKSPSCARTKASSVQRVQKPCTCADSRIDHQRPLDALCSPDPNARYPYIPCCRIMVEAIATFVVSRRKPTGRGSCRTQVAAHLGGRTSCETRTRSST